MLGRWLANTPLELEQKASLCNLLTFSSSEFVEFLNRLFTHLSSDLSIATTGECMHGMESHTEREGDVDSVHAAVHFFW